MTYHLPSPQPCTLCDLPGRHAHDEQVAEERTVYARHTCPFCGARVERYATAWVYGAGRVAHVDCALETYGLR